MALRSPTVRRRRLAAELRRLRKQCGKTREEVAEHIGVVPATITRIENASSGARPAEVQLMLDLYGVDGEERATLLQLAREAKRRGWWHQYGKVVPAWFQVYVGLEAETQRFLWYEAEQIPGLFQTEGYMRALIEAESQKLSEDELDRQVKLRIGRQGVLDSDGPPEMWVIVNEAALHRLVGDREVMLDQLERLIDASKLPKVDLQVLPFAHGAHPSPHGSFTILGFQKPMDSDVVYIELRSSALYLEQPDEISTYKVMFDHLKAKALPTDKSVQLIRRVMKSLPPDDD